MVGKKSGKALRDEGRVDVPLHSPITHARRHKLTIISGLERTDNNMDLSSWPQVQAINQKNYYTYVRLLRRNLVRQLEQ